MKTIKILLVPAILLGFLIYSCDKIEQPYFKPGTVDTSEIKSGDTLKNVLLEDYTGHACPNCPRAAHTAHRLQDSTYHQRLVIIAIHAGHFASTVIWGPLYDYDFNTDAGTAWDNFYKISTDFGNPKGLVDRIEYEGKTVLEPSKWDGAIGNRDGGEFLAKITIENNFNSGSKSLNSTIQTEFQKDLEGAYTLIACVVQDNFVSPQKDDDVEGGNDTTYVHNNVLRGSINGDWGEKIATNPTGNAVVEKSYSVNFKDDWVPEDCRVVAYVYNEATKEVIQVDEEWVKK